MQSLAQQLRVLALIFFAALASCGGAEGSGSGSTPAADIPSPVSHLSISSPDANGISRVSGAPGFADAGTTVSVSLSTSSSSSLARALETPSSQESASTATANEDGSFTSTISASAGNSVTVDCTLNGSAAQKSSSVPEGQPALSNTAILSDVSVDGLLAQAGVVSNDGTDGYATLIDMSALTVSGELVIEGASGLSRVSVDTQTGIYYALDTDNGFLFEIDPETGDTDTAEVNNPADIAAGESGNFAIVSHSDGSSPASYYSVATDSSTAAPDLTASTGATHVRSPFVDAQWGGFVDEFAVVSEMSDGNYYVFLYVAADSSTLTESFEAQLFGTITAVTDPGGIALFNEATEVLVTDRATDRVIRIDFMAGSISTIDVGDDPRGVTVDDINGLAYVANAGDHTVSLITLADNEIAAEVDVGITPVAVDVDGTSSLSAAAVINAGDATATIIVP